MCLYPYVETMNKDRTSSLLCSRIIIYVTSCIKREWKETKKYYNWGYIRCSWGQPDIHTAAYSNTQREIFGRDKRGQSMQSERWRRKGKIHVRTCKEGGCVIYHTFEITLFFIHTLHYNSTHCMNQRTFVTWSMWVKLNVFLFIPFRMNNNYQ